MPRVVIAAGGTAGHVVPALAIADALRAEGASVSFIGTCGRAEASLVPEAGYEIDFLEVRGIDRRNPIAAGGALARAAAALPAARRILRRRRAEAVMGGGGYVAGPAGLAALTLRLPLILTEADSHLGLTNRMLAGRARRVCLAFPLQGRGGERFVVTGRPIPAAIVEADRDQARRELGIDPAKPCLLVFGGSLGARSINQAAIAAFADPAGPGAGRGFEVLHLSGRRDYAECRSSIDAFDPPGYRLVEYLPGLAQALAASDLVLARSGGSVFEIAAAARPAILVPYPHASADHQTTNAAWMVDAGAAEMIADAELDPARLWGLASGLLADQERLRSMAQASASLARPDAAQRIAAEILAQL